MKIPRCFDPKSKLVSVLVAALAICAPVGVARADESKIICNYCIQMDTIKSFQVLWSGGNVGPSDLSVVTPAQRRSYVTLSPDFFASVNLASITGITILLNGSNKVETRMVCEGTETIHKGKIVITNASSSAPQESLSHVTICDGVMVDLDTYRSKPFQGLITSLRTSYNADVKNAQAALSESNIKAYLAVQLKALYDQERESLTDAAAKRAVVMLAPVPPAKTK